MCTMASMSEQLPEPRREGLADNLSLGRPGGPGSSMSRQLPEQQQEGPMGRGPRERTTTQTPVGRPWWARTSLIRQLHGFQWESLVDQDLQD